jgi:hypothetical protein
MNQVVYTNKRRIKRYNHTGRFIFWHINVNEFIKKKSKLFHLRYYLKESESGSEPTFIYIYVYIYTSEN